MSSSTKQTQASAARTGRGQYWQRFTDGQRPPGDQLAALRRGIGKDAGSVPALWPFYTTLTPDGRRTRGLLAEHLALTLFAVHQQSQTRLMHRDDVGLGRAILALRNSGDYSPEAVDRRFAAAATATSVGELAVHLRGLVTQLRGLHQPLDYSRLMQDLRDWQSADRAAGVRRRWGGQYFAPPRSETAPGTTDPATERAGRRDQT